MKKKKQKFWFLENFLSPEKKNKLFFDFFTFQQDRLIRDGRYMITAMVNPTVKQRKTFELFFL